MRHYSDDIDGYFDFQSLYAWAVWALGRNVGRAHFVEVGAYLGASTAFMATEIINSGLPIQFDTVDHFLGSREHQQLPEVVNGTLYEEFLRNIQPVQQFVRVRMGYSVEVAATYRDQSLDFIFIDASHEEDPFRADVEAWFPKLKLGGVMAGHDYSYPSIKKVVHEFFDGRPVTPLPLHASSWCLVNATMATATTAWPAKPNSHEIRESVAPDPNAEILAELQQEYRPSTSDKE